MAPSTMIATPTTITTITPGLKPRLFGTAPLPEGQDFFDGTEAFFRFSLNFVFVLNWFLLLGVCFPRFDGFFHSCHSCRVYAVVCSPSHLPECVPGQPTEQDEEDERACPVRNKGEGIGHD